MLGLGEGLDEVRGVLADLKEAGCSYDFSHRQIPPLGSSDLPLIPDTTNASPDECPLFPGRNAKYFEIKI